MNVTDKLQEHMNTALHSILAAIVLTGGACYGNDIPTDAIDAALSTDPNVRNARQALHVALRGLGTSAAGDDTRQAILAAEEAVTALVVAAADAAYRVGVGVGRGFQE